MIQEQIDFPTLDFKTTQLDLLESALRKALGASGISQATAQLVPIVFTQGSIIAEINFQVRADILMVQNNKATIRESTIQYLQTTIDLESGADLVTSTADDKEDYATASSTTIALSVCLFGVALALVVGAVFAIIRKSKFMVVLQVDDYDVSATTDDDTDNHIYMELHPDGLVAGLNTLSIPPRRNDGFATAIEALESSKGSQNAFDLEDPVNGGDLAEIWKRTDISRGMQGKGIHKNGEARKVRKLPEPPRHVWL